MTHQPESAPNSTKGRGLRRKVARGLGIITAVAMLPTAVWGLSKANETEHQGTHFASAADAMATLRADAKNHLYDQDCFGPDQDRMEKDLRGANPLLMQKLGDQVVKATVRPQDITLPNHNKLAVFSVQLDNGMRSDTVQLTTPQLDQTEVDLTVNPNGSFEKLSYSQGNINMSNSYNIIGGPSFQYGFGGNDYEDSNTAQYASGQPLSNMPASAIIDNNTYFSALMAAGPAINTAVTDYDAAEQLLKVALSEQ